MNGGESIEMAVSSPMIAPRAVRFLPFPPPPLIYLVGKAALDDGDGEDGGVDDDGDIRHGANQACKKWSPLRRSDDTKTAFVFRDEVSH